MITLDISPKKSQNSKNKSIMMKKKIGYIQKKKK